jgi:RNA polymerase sigma-70 factor (ECF subfamily)
MSAPEHSAAERGAAHFATTHWSVVLAAGEGDSPQAADALARLCRAYWFPLYAYVRRQGHDVPDAQDLTQEFFARLLEKNYLKSAAREKGRFRSFLLIALKRFLANEWERARAQKRGGGQALIELDAASAEERYRLEPADVASADRVYERRWALALLDQVLLRLRDEAARAGKAGQFELLKAFLYGEKAPLSQLEIGARLGLSESAIKSAVHRLRQRYRELLRQEVAQTVASPADAEDELRHLLNVLSG